MPEKTYTEIFEFIWDDIADEERKRRIEALSPEERTAWRTLEMLGGRKGFEYWWCPRAVGGMEEEQNDEIFEEMKKIIAAEFSKP